MTCTKRVTIPLHLFLWSIIGKIGNDYGWMYSDGWSMTMCVTLLLKDDTLISPRASNPTLFGRNAYTQESLLAESLPHLAVHFALLLKPCMGWCKFLAHKATNAFTKNVLQNALVKVPCHIRLRSKITWSGEKIALDPTSIMFGIWQGASREEDRHRMPWELAARKSAFLTQSMFPKKLSLRKQIKMFFEGQIIFNTH